MELFVSDFVELSFFRPTRSSVKYGVDLCMTDQKLWFFSVAEQISLIQ